LPAWRGAAPVAHAILHGDHETGVSCFVLDEGMDTGPVLTEARTTIGGEETAGALTRRLAELGAPALVDAVRGWVAGSISPRAQPAQGATYAPKVRPADAVLDWSQTAERIDRAVRAFNPAPGAHTTFAGQRLKVHRARPVSAVGPPGRIVGIDVDGDRGGPVVATGRGGLRLDEVQPAGKASMSGAAFANGYRPEGRTLGDGEDA
jgi:methionyl-tRNA formyltransferase